MKPKRMMGAILALTMCMGLAACGSSGSTGTAAAGSSPASSAAADSDAAYIEGNGVLKIGYTIFEPQNFRDKDGNLTGFDTEYAEAVCEKLGLTPEFIEINWDTKEIELNSRNIDCIWNGTTVTEERRATMEFSDSYLVNGQVVVIRKADADKYTDVESLAGARMSVQVGSSGEDCVQADAILSKNESSAVAQQTDCLLEVKAGQADAAVIDMSMATSYCKDGTDYDSLMMLPGVTLAEEENAIAFRKGSDFVEKVNAATQELRDAGFMQELADKYGLVLYNK